MVQLIPERFCPSIIEQPERQALGNTGMVEGEKEWKAEDGRA